MIKTKYKVTLIDSKWSIIKNRINLEIIPRKDEILYFDGEYYYVVNIVHRVDGEQGVFLVVDLFSHQIRNNEREKEM